MSMGYPPRIEISIERVPGSNDSEPLRLSVEGLSEDAIFQILPGI